jgi:voltage-gated potassium channel
VAHAGYGSFASLRGTGTLNRVPPKVTQRGFDAGGVSADASLQLSCTWRARCRGQLGTADQRRSGIDKVAAEQDRQDSLRMRVFEILEHGRRREPASRAIDWLLVVLVVANVIATVAHTIPEIAARHGAALQLLDRLCVLVFAIEYLARIWVAPEHPLLHRYTPAGARLRFAATPLMMIDALALLPLVLELLFPRNELLLLTRLMRFLELARYSPALATLGRLIASAVQPDKLGDMPKAIWWAASMLAKIGGGELVPMTTLGRIIAAITVMLGIVCFALPVAIIGRGFYEEIRRRDFVVTFGMVARVPLFARLDAAAIAGLVGMLRARTVPAGTTIIRKGGRGDAMYFIASGRVEVESANDKVVLQEGDFFGEIALLSREPRSATVTALHRGSLGIGMDVRAISARECDRSA